MTPKSNVKKFLHTTPKEIISFYKEIMRSLFNEKNPGQIRGKKGALVEQIARDLVAVAWKRLGYKLSELELKNSKYSIPPLDLDKYLNRLPDKRIRDYIVKHRENYVYKLGCDVQCYYKNKFLLAIECKTYTENAMLKRILVDSFLLKSKFPDTKFVLLQLESMLGGDYSELKRVVHGSEATHTLMSHFDLDLHIITLLKGERNIKKPIHKINYKKHLMPEILERAVTDMKRLIKCSMK